MSQAMAPFPYPAHRLACADSRNWLSDKTTRVRPVREALQLGQAHEAASGWEWAPTTDRECGVARRRFVAVEGAWGKV